MSARLDRSSTLMLVSLFVLANVPACVCGADSQLGILIEAEDDIRIVSAEKDFASPTRERAASRRKVLARFNRKGHVLYRFRVPAEATYTGWLRYASNRATHIGFAVDPQAAPKRITVSLAATGGLAGPDVWGWAKLFRVKLSAGEHTLTLGSAGLVNLPKWRQVVVLRF